MRPSSNSSPRISFSRSSSRSFQDDFDDPDFPCPFDVEYDDITDRSSRYCLKNLTYLIVSFLLHLHTIFRYLSVVFLSGSLLYFKTN